MHKPRVLIVDDSKLVRMHTLKILVECGFEVETAEDGQEGCQQVFVCHPDVILMDISMPVMDGISAVKFLKGNQQTKHIPIVVFTNETETEEKVRALEAGANDLISKDAERTELIARVRNLVKLKALEDEILFERDKMRSILNDLSQAVVIVDRQNRVILVNAVARTLLGVPPELEGGLKIDQLMASSGEAAEVMRCLKEVDVIEREINLDTSEGRRIFLVRFSPIYLSNTTHFGNALIFRDVTQAKEMEEMKASFHSMIAHDLRSPITVITGYTGLLLGRKAGELADIQVEFLQAVEERANAMRKLVDEFLMVSKFESSVISLDTMEVDINALIGDVTRSLSLIASNKKIDVHQDLEPSLPVIQGDSAKLHKVFSNLYDNAVKYTPEEGNVWICSRVEDDRVLISFKDDGIGIDEEELPYVFDRYKRMATAGKHKIHGTGLGLAIVKEIVTAHYGRVWVKGKADQGCTFFVELPLRFSAKETLELAETVK